MTELARLTSVAEFFDSRATVGAWQRTDGRSTLRIRLPHSDPRRLEWVRHVLGHGAVRRRGSHYVYAVEGTRAVPAVLAALRPHLHRLADVADQLLAAHPDIQPVTRCVVDRCRRRPVARHLCERHYRAARRAAAAASGWHTLPAEAHPGFVTVPSRWAVGPVDPAPPARPGRARDEASLVLPDGTRVVIEVKSGRDPDAAHPAIAIGQALEYADYLLTLTCDDPLAATSATLTVRLRPAATAAGVPVRS